MVSGQTCTSCVARLLLLNVRSCWKETCLITGWLQTPRLLLCQDGGHLGVRSDILSNCIILLSMLTGYVIFHRSAPIIRARLSQKDPPDVCDPCAIGLGAAPTDLDTSEPHTVSVFGEKVPRALQRKCLAEERGQHSYRWLTETEEHGG